MNNNICLSKHEENFKYLEGCCLNEINCVKTKLRDLLYKQEQNQFYKRQIDFAKSNNICQFDEYKFMQNERTSYEYELEQKYFTDYDINNIILSSIGIGIKDKNGRDIHIGNKIKHNDDIWIIGFGEYIDEGLGYSYNAYGTYIRSIGNDTMPIDLDIIKECEVIS